MPNTFLSVVGAVILITIGAIVVMAIVDFFLFAPRRDRERAENYETSSIDPTGPFCWIPISRKRDKPVYSESARAQEQVRKMQFVILLLLLGISAAAIFLYCA